MWPLSVGWPGRVNASATWCGDAQASSALDVHSVPWSTLIDRGKSAVACTRSNSAATSATVTRLAPSNTLKVVRVGKVLTLKTEWQPVEAADAWTVRENGEVLIIRVSDYHVDILSRDGERHAGPLLGREREGAAATAKRELSRLPTVLNYRGVSMRSRDGATDARRVHPAFVANSAMLDTRGRLWVMRIDETGSYPQAYDVIDSAGRLLESVEMPPDVRLVGFGTNALFTARMLDTQHEVLERHRM